MINWKVRLKNRMFWVSIIPAVVLLITQVCGMFGVEINLTEIQDYLLDIVTTIFAILALLGVVVDHTTAGMGDSQQALSYDAPKKEIDE